KVDQLSKPSAHLAAHTEAKEDTFTLFNYDSDWRGNNNWDNIYFYKITPAAYYSVVEDDRYYYIGYYFYYPRWGVRIRNDNQFTGVLLAVKKSHKGYGQLDRMVFYNNRDWQSAKGIYEGTYGNVRIKIAAGSHQLSMQSNNKLSKREGILLRPEALLAKGSPSELTSGYKLVSMNELWNRRNEIKEGQKYQLSSGDNNKCSSLPWDWQHRGINWLSDPKAFFAALGKVPQSSSRYIVNPYQE
ncbi:MAG: hypothetical protein H7X79_06810, partial [Sporomusaceae bacterium]|nr:hypothetical protein [Sporomusaceae bacterium]